MKVGDITMDTQTKRILSLREILALLINKEVYVYCCHGPLSISGTLVGTKFRTLTLHLENGTQKNISLTEIFNINIPLEKDNGFAFEANMVSLNSKRFNRYLNKHVICLVNEQKWGVCGTLTYIGNDYITILNEEDSEVFRVPVSTIHSLSSNWSELTL